MHSDAKALSAVRMVGSYLADTRQIDLLALRQAALLCRALNDASRHDEALAVVLLALAALRRGAPRADMNVLLAPLSADTVSGHARQFRAEHNTEAPWSASVSGLRECIVETVGRLLADPLLFSPVSGTEPAAKDGKWPLLVAGNNAIGFSRSWVAVTHLENQLLPNLVRGEFDDPDPQVLADALHAVFSVSPILSGGGRFHYRQCAAAILACKSRFLIVSGGPGTGKTSVVIQMLRTLLRVYPELRPDRIVLCAPTGRAKARLGEGLDTGIDILENRFGEHGATEAAALRQIGRKTLHSLLGMRSDGSFRHSAGHPLNHQVVVVDEASMVDVHLFASLIESLPAGCRLVLVGDMHQLPPVEAGALLGDLTGRFTGATGGATLSPQTAEWLHRIISKLNVDDDDGDQSMAGAIDGKFATAGTLIDRVVLLTRSYRAKGAALSELASCVNRGDADGTLKLLSGNGNEISMVAPANDDAFLETWIRRRFSAQHYTAVQALERVFSPPGESITPDQNRVIRRALEASVILTLSHEGKRGRITINARAMAILKATQRENRGEVFFHGVPVVLGANHHDLDLYNGDIGMVVRTAAGMLKVAFPRKDRCIVVAIDRLRQLDVAFALTVHKSQGSEFDEVLLVLPEFTSALLTRQIVYTGITRARSMVAIYGSPAILAKAVETREERPGGVVIG